MMLSTVEIFAAGATGQENLDLFIDDQYVTTFFNVGGDVDQRDFVRLTYQSDQPLTPGRVGVAFGNDHFDPNTGFDRNLLVDRIVVEGVEAQTEDASTFSTGIYRDGLTGPGFFQTELFNVNAIFSYADPAVNGDWVEFTAVGTTGEEIVELVINDQVVQSFSFDSAGSPQTFFFDTSDDLSIEDVRIQFVNDLFDPAAGIDRNVQIFDFRVVDGATGSIEAANTSDSNVLSSGIFVDGVGITSGLGAGGYLAANGFVEVVSDAAAGTNLAVDDSFSAVEISNELLEVGPDNQVAFLNPADDLFLVDSNGQTVTSFGAGGQINVADILEPLTGLDEAAVTALLPAGFVRFPGDPLIVTNVSDIEFFSDGSLLVTGSFRPNAPPVLSTPATLVNTPFVLRINPDGTLDPSFTQQGVLQGTFTQLTLGDVEVQSAIDQEGRIIIFSSNASSELIADQNLVVARLNPNGTLDTSFGNGGNVFVPLSSFGFSGISTPLDVEITSDNQIAIGAQVFLPQESVAIVNIAENGSLDSSFGNGGVFVTEVDTFIELLQFQLDSQDRIVISGDASVSEAAFIIRPLLIRATADGQLDTSFGVDGMLLLDPDDSIASQGVDTDPMFGFLNLTANGLAIDESDNILVASSADSTDPDSDSDLAIFQRVLSSGQLDTSFGIGGTSVLTSQGGVTDLVFDSNNDLIIGSLSPFLFSSSTGGVERLTFV